MVGSSNNITQCTTLVKYWVLSSEAIRACQLHANQSRGGGVHLSGISSGSSMRVAAEAVRFYLSSMNVPKTIRLLEGANRETKTLPSVGDTVPLSFTSDEVKCVDFGQWQEMKEKYPVEAASVLKNLVGADEATFGRCWVLQSQGQLFLVGRGQLQAFMSPATH